MTLILAVSLLCSQAGAAPSFAAVAADERRAVEILSQLAAVEPDRVKAGVAAAHPTHAALYDGPLRAVLRSGLPSEVRAAAAAALADLEWPSAATELNARIDDLGRAARGGDARIAEAAMRALGNYPTPEVRRLLAAVAAGAGEKERAIARQALDKMRSRAALDRLAQYLGREEEAEGTYGAPASWRLALACRQVVAAPESAASHEAIDAILAAEPALVREIVGYAARNGRGYVRERALAELAVRPGDPGTALALIDDPEPRVRRAALLLLKGQASARVAAAAAKRLAEEPDSYLISSIVAVLRAQESAPLAEALLPVLRQARPERRRIAVDLVRERQGVETVWAKTVALSVAWSEEALASLVEEDPQARRRELVPRLGDADLTSEERRAVLAGLARTEDPATGRAVLAQLGSDAAPGLVRAAGLALADQDDALVVPPLSRLMERAQGDTRAALAVLLAQRPSPAAAKALAAAIQNEREPAVAANIMAASRGRREPVVIAALAGRLVLASGAEVVDAALAALADVDDVTLARTFAEVSARAALPPRTRFAALDRLAALSDPGALAIVRELAQNRDLAAGLRLRVIVLVGERGAPADLALLQTLVAESDAEVRATARNAMHIISPELYPEWDQRGRYVLVPAAGAFGTTLLLLSTRIAEQIRDEEIRKVLPGMAGAAIGLTPAWLLSEGADVSLGQAGYFTTLGAWGTAGGYGLLRLTDPADRTASLWGAVGGELVGVGMGWATLRQARFGSGDVVLTNTVAAAWGAGALSMAYLTRLSTDGSRAPGVFALGGAAAMAPMVVLSPNLKLDAEALAGVAWSVGMASFVGALAPRAFAPDRRDLDTWAGIGLGQAVGLTGGLVLARTSGFDRRTLLWSTVGATAGAAGGYGLGMSEPRLHGRSTYALLEAGTLIGAGALAWAAPHLELSATDFVLVALTTAVGAASGARAPAQVYREAGVDENLTLKSRWGGALLGGSLGLFTGIAAAQFVELSPGELSLTGFGAAVLGTGLGGVVLLFPELTERGAGGAAPAGAPGLQFSGAFAAGAVLGVLGLGAYLAPRLRYEPDDISLGVSTAVMGASLGSLLPAYRTPEGVALADSEQAGGAMLGGAAGLLFAGVVSQFVDVDPQRVLRVDIGALSGLAIGAGLGLVTPPSLTPDYDRRLTVALMHGGVVAGYTFAALSERKREYSLADRAHLALGVALGSGHGALIPYTWRSEAPPREEITGGLILGAGAGLTLTRLAVALGNKEVPDIYEIAVYDFLASAAAYGSWDYVGTGNLSRRYQLVQAAGLGGWLLGELAATRTVYSANDRKLVASLVTAGAIGGAGLPYFASDEPQREQFLRGAALGAGALGLAGMGLALVSEIEARELIVALVGGGVGAAGAWGVGRAQRRADDALTLRFADAGFWAGLGAGLAAAPYVRLDDNDTTWVGAATVLGAWVGGLRPQWDCGGRATDAQRTGAAVAGATAGAVLASGVMTFADWQDAGAYEGVVVGSAAGVAALALARLGVPRRPDAQALVQQLAALAGFATGALAAPYTRFSDGDLSMLLTLTVVGAAYGSYLPTAMAEGRSDARANGAVGGAGAGLVTAYALSQVTDFDAVDNLEALAFSGTGALMASGAARLYGWGERDAARALIAAGSGGLALGLTLAPHSTYSASDMQLIAAGSVWGAWHGLFFGLHEGRNVPGSERSKGEGGAMLGAGVGIATLTGLSQVVDLKQRDFGETSIMAAAGNALGFGAGSFFDLGDSAAIGLLHAGGIAGIATGLSLSQHTRYTPSDHVLIMSTTLIGTAHGALLATTFHDEPTREQSAGGALFGGGIGLAGGMALAQVLSLEAGDLAEVAMATLAGDIMAAGVAQWLRLDPPSTSMLVSVSGLSLTAASLALAETTRYERGDRLLALWGASAGGWLGFWAPRMWETPADTDARIDQALGSLAGAGAGLLLSAGVAQLTDYAPGDVGEVAFGGTSGALIGAGLGLVLRPDRELWVPLMEGGALAGSVWFATQASQIDYTAGDLTLGVLAASYGLYQGAGLSLLADATDRQVAGAMLATGAAGAIMGSYVGRYISLTGNDVLMLLAGSAWGVWIGIWSAAAIEERSDGAGSKGVFSLGVGTTAVATDLTLVATSIAISRLVEMPPKQFAWISVAGGAGLVGGLLTANVAGTSPRAGIALGSAAGLALGAVGTSFLTWEKPRDESPLAQGSPPDWMPQVDYWFPNVVMGPATSDDASRPGADTQVLVTVTGSYR